MVIYPLSAGEDRTVRWVSRIVPATAIAVILLLGAISFASVQV